MEPNPTLLLCLRACPWGEKAFSGYLGSVEAGKAYDATELAKDYSGPPLSIIIDQVC
jgi:S-formylglutathione hydrolase